MNRVLAPAIIILILTVSFISFREPAEKVKIYSSHYENILGTSLSLKVGAESEEQADLAESRALGEIDRLSAIFSAYDSASEFSRWMHSDGEPVTVSGELFEVLSLFDYWKDNTNGALNPAAETISRVWKESARMQQLPDNNALQSAVRQAGQKHWLLEVKTGTAQKLDAAPLITNSFVKSYIIRKVADSITAMPGIHSAIVNIGGDIVVSGDRDEDISVADPLADAENDIPYTTIHVRNKAVATSGNYRRGYNILGKWYSHILDPRSGMPAEKIISATVVAPSATDAGALATAFNILDTAECRRLAASMPGVDYLLITAGGERMESQGWHLLEDKTLKKGSNGSTSGHLSVQNDYELVVNMELAQSPGWSRRPFVAVWVENDKKEPVRSLALWFNKMRWLPELKAWYRTDYHELVNSLSGAASISSATRPAGKYSLKWDMKDDKGNPVKPGTYTIFVEAAREHGTYQLTQQEVDCKKKESSVEVTGGSEISSINLQYRKLSSNQ